jgi:hypothetical protein
MRGACMCFVLCAYFYFQLPPFFFFFYVLFNAVYSRTTVSGFFTSNYLPSSDLTCLLVFMEIAFDPSWQRSNNSPF